MKKIISVGEGASISKKLKAKGNSIIVAGGVFDLLHIGHIKFLKQAKKKGDFLFVLLESDESVRKSKGAGRPINSQKDRALVLSSVAYVDFVINLRGNLKNQAYDSIIKRLLPDILATTAKDPKIEHKKRQAKTIGAKVVEVIERIPEKSTSKILDSIK